MKKVKIHKKSSKQTPNTTGSIKSTLHRQKALKTSSNSTHSTSSKQDKSTSKSTNKTPDKQTDKQSKPSKKSPNKLRKETVDKRGHQYKLGKSPSSILPTPIPFNDNPDIRPARTWTESRTTRMRDSYDGPFKWTPVKAQAAKMIAEGHQSIKEIAGALDVHYMTVYFWCTYRKFWKVVENQILQTGLATEAGRTALIKKRVRQLDAMIDPRLDPTDEFHNMLANNIPTDKLIALEAKLVDILEKRNKGPEEIHHTFSTLNPDEQKVSVIEDLIKTLSPSAADEVKSALIARSAALIKKRRDAAEAAKSQEMDEEE
jgi:transposase-like protein